MNTFFISTTSTIQNATSIQYLDVVYTNVVIGTNMFSDFAASFTDFFGGKSNTYQNKLTLIYNNALSDIRRKAFAIGANAVIGFRIDFDEISGKDKSMLMVNLSGTACIVDIPETESTNTSHTPVAITQDALEKEIYRKKLLTQINSGEYLNETMTEFLFENPMPEIIDSLIERYISQHYKGDTFECKFIINYLPLLPKSLVLDKVYDKYLENLEGIKKLIFMANLFSAHHILAILQKGNIAPAISLLDAPASSYTQQDVAIMKQISEFFNHLPDTGRIETVKSGIFGKEQSMFICQNGHKSNPDEQFCTNYYCGVNIKGLTKYDLQKIKDFSEKTDILSKMFL